MALYEEWKNREPLVFEYEGDLPNDTVDENNESDAEENNKGANEVVEL